MYRRLMNWHHRLPSWVNKERPYHRPLPTLQTPKREAKFPQGTRRDPKMEKGDLPRGRKPGRPKRVVKKANEIAYIGDVTQMCLQSYAKSLKEDDQRVAMTTQLSELQDALARVVSQLEG